MNWLNWRERWALSFRLRLRERMLRRAAEKSPDAFRHDLLIRDNDDAQFQPLVQPWQQKDFQALDAAWLTLAGRNVGASLKRAYIERPRGHAKTADMAVQIAWILLYAEHTVEGVAAAADRDQAALVWNAVRRLARLNPNLCGDLEFRKHLIRNPKTGSQLDVVSSDARSSWGTLPDFVICDELCHWDKPDLWHSLASSAAKKPNCVLIVLTNAGVGRGWNTIRKEWTISCDQMLSLREAFDVTANPSKVL